MRIVFALLLVMHYSLAFGAIEAAAMPDEHHPFGKAIQHDHLHQHSHDHHDDLAIDLDNGYDHEQNISSHNDSAGEFHDHHHKHGINIQLNMDLPGLFSLDLYKTDSPPATPYRLHHNSLSYAPAVPPPNRL